MFGSYHLLKLSFNHQPLSRKISSNKQQRRCISIRADPFHARTKHYFEWLSAKQGWTSMEDYYKISQSVLMQNRGYGVLNSYQGSVIKALKSAFPEYPWMLWKFQKTPQKFWKQLDNQRKFLEWFASAKQLKTLDDFYSITNEEIIRFGGRALLNQHRNSLSRCLQVLYPHHPWKAWKLPKCPTHFWKDLSKVAQCMAEVSSKLDITCLEDWYRVSVRQMIQIAEAGSLVQYYKGILPILRLLYPSYPWDPQRFHRSTKKSAQRYLFLKSHLLEIMENFRHPSLRCLGGQLLELDVYIPSLSLGFEYQGEHHYRSIHYFGAQQHIQQKDAEKKVLCKKHNIRLVEVPYWWDQSKASLIKMITETQPDLGKEWKPSLS